MGPTFIDSSVLVAAFNEKDALFERATKGLHNTALPLLVHEYVLLETATVLMIRESKALADEFVNVMFNNAAFAIVPSSIENLRATAATFKENRTKLSFTDAALLTLSKEYEVLTFDEALQKAIRRQKN